MSQHDGQYSDARSSGAPPSGATLGSVLTSALLFPVQATDATLRFGFKTVAYLLRGVRS